MSFSFMSTKIIELFAFARDKSVDWRDVVQRQYCPYLNRKCIKVRKSRPKISIGTCTVQYGREDTSVIICPYRLLERKQVFTDSLHLLTLHEPGNELHVVTEVTIPGGSVDYFLVSTKARKVMDFVGVELQTLDTTGTLWPERQRFLQSKGVPVRRGDANSDKGFGMNWKMTAKTILVQLHHKIETFEGINKHLLLVVQDCLLDYMRKEFNFNHLQPGPPRRPDAHPLLCTWCRCDGLAPGAPGAPQYRCSGHLRVPRLASEPERGVGADHQAARIEDLRQDAFDALAGSSAAQNWTGMQPALLKVRALKKDDKVKRVSTWELYGCRNKEKGRVGLFRGRRGPRTEVQAGTRPTEGRLLYAVT